ncbi:neuroglobin [Plakobranchus ocellatus]|uniref:Globin n=1 Tax=Plakobranchus ocellatus TaxID=259542 RepID=A0AAV4AC86_9GAST|nr:neuroglobin [Plakobranchus ocellatus]
MGCNSSSSSASGLPAKEVHDFITSEEVKIIKESWPVVAMDLPATGLHIFTRLFEMEKDFKKLFRRLMSVRESGDYVFDSVRLERHATMVMKHLGQAVENLDDSTYFSELLIALGEKHAAYDVKPEMLPFLWPAIRDGLKMRLGDKFTKEAELAWKHLYDYISHKLEEGMIKATSQASRRGINGFNVCNNSVK